MMRPATVELSLDHLKHNYRILCQRAGTARVMAVVKANAYGHGLALIAPALYAEGCRLFAVTDAVEGCALRALLGNDADITPLSGLFDAEDARMAQEHGLTPVVTEVQQVQWLHEVGFQGRIWLKVDTGMHRLGAADIEALWRMCTTMGLSCAGVMSHLACADMPHHSLNQQQIASFERIRAKLPESLPASLLNSAGLVALPDATYDVVRPGLALYGMEPVPDQPMGLKPVMRWTAAVMQVRPLPKGASVSYGATYRAAKDMQIAVVRLGYGDGLPRGLSHCGWAMYQGNRLPVLGRVCMDYCVLDVSEVAIQVGERVCFLGEHGCLAHEVADVLDTIPYTLTTGIQQRVQRIMR